MFDGVESYRDRFVVTKQVTGKPNNKVKTQTIDGQYYIVRTYVGK
jgi:hypothetical protein